MEPELFYFDSTKLKKLSGTSRERYADANPFPHIYFDDFFPKPVLEHVLAEFPASGAIEWKRYENAQTENLKLACEDETRMGPLTRHLLSACNSSTFLSFLEDLTGIPKLIADPHYRGGGLHQTLPGGHLSIHVDFNRYKRLDLYRRLNLLIYLNRDWKDEWEGHLEFWSTDGKERVKKIAPLFNRVALFSTSEFSYHGHPEPLKVPEGVTRKSLALYYYTTDPGEHVSTTSHSTLFPHMSKKTSFKSTLRRCVPPILIDVLKGTR